MKSAWLAVFTATGFALAGCRSGQSYTRIDLRQDLTPETLARFAG